MQREFPRELTTSSAVNLPITSAKLRLRVVWTGLASIRRTYSAARVPRTTLTTNFVFFISLLYCLDVLLRRSRSTGQKSNAEARNRFSNAGESNQPIQFR